MAFGARFVWQIARDRRNQPATVPPLMPRVWWVPALAAMAVVFVLTAALRTDASQFHREPVSRGFPVAAATVIREDYPDVRLFNVYDFGGYLIHRFDGEQRVFVDGRGEMYGDPFLRRYFSLIYGEPGWQDTFDAEGIDAVLIRHIDGLSRQIQASPEWEQVYGDGLVGLYVRRAVDALPTRIGG